ncbi:MAG: hypothetical protein RBR34_12960, partial [Rhodospirillaceae bacterium]|nr:hypothetical protein [Rhodospirillaceae bacterium]
SENTLENQQTLYMLKACIYMTKKHLFLKCVAKKNIISGKVNEDNQDVFEEITMVNEKTVWRIHTMFLCLFFDKHIRL